MESAGVTDAAGVQAYASPTPSPTKKAEGQIHRLGGADGAVQSRGGQKTMTKSDVTLLFGDMNVCWPV